MSMSCLCNRHLQVKATYLLTSGDFVLQYYRGVSVPGGFCPGKIMSCGFVQGDFVLDSVHSHVMSYRKAYYVSCCSALRRVS